MATGALRPETNGRVRSWPSAAPAAITTNSRTPTAEAGVFTVPPTIAPASTVVLLAAVMADKALAVALGEFVAALRFEDLPPAVVDKAKAVVNHAVTVGMAGFGAARSQAARRAVLAHEGLGARRVGA